MAKVLPIGQPVNDSEREAIAHLREHLPDGFTVIHNFELRQGRNVFEIDIALLGPHCVHLIDVKGTRGLVDVHGNKWYPQRRAPYHSPLAILRSHAKALKSLICDQNPTDRALRSVHVDAAVLMTSPDAHVQDPGGLDAPSVAYLEQCTAFFKSTKRIPADRSTDIRSRLRQIQRAIVGRATPRNAPPCYGNWQVEERLGGTDRYTEYRARHTFLGTKQGSRARLRVYPVDPYLPDAERKVERRRIENAFRAVTALPGHPNILNVRDFFPNEDENQFVLVAEDVTGHALRQHITKASLSLTFDQKIAIVRDILAALKHAHRSDPQVVHRNLTPDAVLVGDSGRALLCGFDYARTGKDQFSTIAEEIVDELDPIYQAPECDKDPSQASEASDLYGAGLIFYELLVGEPAWTSVDDMMDKDAIFPVKPSELKPELPVEFDAWLQGLCAFDVEDRPAHATIALEHFNRIVGTGPREAGTARAVNSFVAATGRPEIDYAALDRGKELANRFRIEEKLGQGGFAVVYRVFDSFSDTSRVLKLIVKDRRSTFERLKREYSILERLPPHPNVVRVVWADKLPRDDTPFMVFEYIPGTGVDSLLESDSFSPDDVKLLGMETLAGLAHLHENRVFHRDIKPSNLLWTDRGVRIIDFNVAVNADDDESRPGGTRRYVPPDLHVGEEMTSEEKTDWDLFALGVTLYECVTGKYPWDGPRPVADTAPKDPRDFNPGLASEFVQVLLQAIAPRRADRFACAAAFREVLSVVATVRIGPATVPVEPPPDLEIGAPALLHPTRPNSNPFVSHLLTMYSQNPRSNAGTRGLDAIGRETYIRTLLDETLRSALLAGDFRLVVVTGNAGDGKTAFIQQIENAIEEASTLERRPNGSTFSWAGRRFITNHDGSQDEDELTNDEVLRAFFAPFEGDDSRGWPQDETWIIAINEGRLVDFLTEHGSRYGRLREIVLAGLAGAAGEDGVSAVNLNLRSVVAPPPGSVGPDSIFDRLLRRLTAEKYWEACAACDLRDRCYVHHNARTLMDPIAGPKVAERLRALYTITHLRGRLHITMRDLRSALAFTLVGTRDCDQIHTLYTTPTADSRQQILNGLYFNAWQGGGSTDRLLALLGQIDVGEATNPDLDRALDYLPPGDRETARFTFAERGNYDTQLLDRRHQELPQDASAGTTAVRMAEHRDYVAMLRRRQFFERRDDHWKEMLLYRKYDEFWQLVTGHQSAELRLETLLLAINRGEGLTDPRRLSDALALRVRVVEHGTVRSYRLFPGERFKLDLPADSGGSFVEHVPSALRLLYTPPGGQPAELVVDLDMYEMLMRLNDGYRPTLEEHQGHYLSLAVFKNVLSSAPYQEVLLTRTGHDFFRIDRKPDGVLSLEAIEAIEAEAV